MIRLTDSQILNLTEALESGMLSYLNIQTGEIKSILESDNTFASADKNTIKENRKEYVKINNIPSYESFKIMEQFIETLHAPDIKDELYYALDRNKPFQKFNNTLSSYPDLTQKWLQFKSDKYKEWVTSQLSSSLIN